MNKALCRTDITLNICIFSYATKSSDSIPFEINAAFMAYYALNKTMVRSKMVSAYVIICI